MVWLMHSASDRLWNHPAWWSRLATCSSPKPFYLFRFQLRNLQETCLPEFSHVLSSTRKDGLFTGLHWAYKTLGELSSIRCLIIHVRLRAIAHVGACRHNLKGNQRPSDSVRPCGEDKRIHPYGLLGSHRRRLALSPYRRWIAGNGS